MPSAGPPGEVDEPATAAGPCSIAVFAPSPVLTVTIEQGPGSSPEIHLHAGGQGYWVARIATVLGAQVSFCAPLGGESGSVLRAILKETGIGLLGVRTAAANGAYVHDRRRGSRVEVAASEGLRLERHEVDELYGVALTAGMAAKVTLLTGPEGEHVIPDEIYARLATDLRANGRTVVADLTGKPLRSALAGGLDLLKLSQEELVVEGLADDESESGLIGGVRALGASGARNVVISRGVEPALACLSGRLVELVGPHFVAADSRGTGDAMFGATGVGLAMGLKLEDALRMGVAAGALNATRHGLGSGHAAEIEQLRSAVEIRSLG